MSRTVCMLNVVMIGAFLAVIAGCGPPRSALVGTWHGTMEGPTGESGTMTMVFNDDGTTVQTFKSPEKTIEFKATYTTDAGKLRLILTGLTEDGKSQPATQAPPRDMLYIFEDDDHLTIGQSNTEKFTLTKVK